MGTLVKQHVASLKGLEPDKVYHVAVMPCYDKKLEASRKDFYSDVYSTRDVDCVITTGELEQMLAEYSVSIASLPDAHLTSTMDSLLGVAGEPMLSRTEGSSSGGYLSFIMRYAAFHLYGVALDISDIEKGRNGVTVTPGRNSDFVTVAFTPPGHLAPALLFAYAYGFKNIQNVVRKLKPKASVRPSSNKEKYHFVEIMACPSGCINGGGQLKSDQDIRSAQRIESLNQVFHDASLPLRTPETNQAVEQVYKQFADTPEKIAQHLHTAYHALERTPDALNVQW
jgi:iron only hydrogenase large subunit-like protein